MNDKPAKIEMVTLKQLCAELKVDPREARERLRLAVRDAKKNPELAKSHKPGQHMGMAEELPRPERSTHSAHLRDKIECARQQLVFAPLLLTSSALRLVLPGTTNLAALES